MTTPDASSDEFADYLARRKRGRKMIFGGLLGLFIAIVAVPYVLMQLGVLTKSTFEIFVCFDVVVLIGCIRAAVLGFEDSAF